MSETVTYMGLDGEPFTVTYDPQAPCIICGLPVIAASMGGTSVCPWCDCGNYRDGCSWVYRYDPKERRMKPMFPHPEHAKAKGESE